MVYYWTLPKHTGGLYSGMPSILCQAQSSVIVYRMHLHNSLNPAQGNTPIRMYPHLMQPIAPDGTHVQCIQTGGMYTICLSLLSF